MEGAAGGPTGASSESDTSARKLLGSWTLLRYLSTRPPCHVVVLDTQMTVSQALRLFATHHILSAPLFDAGTRDFVGFLDVYDLLCHLIDVCNPREMTPDDMEFKLRVAGAPRRRWPLRRGLTALLQGKKRAHA